MSREEEIEKASNNYFIDFRLAGGKRTLQEHFERGAQWADQHSRKGLWDAEKVIDWLKKNCTYTHPRKGTEECFINLFALKDAMED